MRYVSRAWWVGYCWSNNDTAYQSRRFEIEEPRSELESRQMDWMDISSLGIDYALDLEGEGGGQGGNGFPGDKDALSHHMGGRKGRGRMRWIEAMDGRKRMVMMMTMMRTQE